MLNKYKEQIIFFGLFAVFALIVSCCLSLTESTEARYAEIAREMLLNGNWLEPTLNGIYHFHKPPMAYWLMASGMSIWGINEFGVRFFGVIFSLLSLYYFYRLARLFLDEQLSYIATLCLATCGLFVLHVHIVSTDIYLLFFALASQFYIFRGIQTGRVSILDKVLIAVFLAGGFLTKGPVIFLFTVLPLLIYALTHRLRVSITAILQISILFALLALPWYLYVSSLHEGLLDYFLGKQVHDRVLTNYFGRQEPWYYYLLCLVTGVFPYIFLFLRALFTKPQHKYLLWFIAIPLIIFQISISKLSSYLLPVLPIIILFTVINSQSIQYKIWQWKPVIYTLALLYGIALLTIGYISHHKLGIDSRHAKYLGKYEYNAYLINKLNPMKNIDILIYDANFYSIDFYTGQSA